MGLEADGMGQSGLGHGSEWFGAWVTGCGRGHGSEGLGLTNVEVDIRTLKIP